MPASIYGNQSGTVGLINALTAQNSTSGTNIDFTGIPTGVKRITVMFNGVSTNGSSLVQVQIGAGSVTSSGYVSYTAYAGGTNAAANATATTGFLVDSGGSAATAWLRNGIITICNISGNSWVNSSTIGMFDGTARYMICGGGNVTLSGTLDRVRITTVGGTDTFDAGSINILYE